MCFVRWIKYVRNRDSSCPKRVAFHIHFILFIYSRSEFDVKKSSSRTLSGAIRAFRIADVLPNAKTTELWITRFDRRRSMLNRIKLDILFFVLWKFNSINYTMLSKAYVYVKRIQNFTLAWFLCLKKSDTHNKHNSDCWKLWSFSRTPKSVVHIWVNVKTPVLC